MKHVQGNRLHREKLRRLFAQRSNSWLGLYDMSRRRAFEKQHAFGAKTFCSQSLAS
jgi:hypothetical protein